MYHDASRNGWQHIGARFGSSRSVMSALVATLLVTSLSQMFATAAVASSVVDATFVGGSGSASVGGVLYARSGAALTLTATTDTATNCVSLSGAHVGSSSVPTASNAASKTWDFAVSAASGADGARTTTVTARDDAGCAGPGSNVNVSYTVDNTAPTVTAAISP